MFEGIITELYGATTYRVIAIIFSFYPIWLPIISAVIFWELWVRYVRYLFDLKTEKVLLQIKLPREISRSPVAMELAVLALHQVGGEFTVYDRYWSGKHRAIFSLEIVSIGGQVNFYVWLRKNTRNLVEAQFYSQYPNIEITEVVDYTKMIVYKPEENSIWGVHYIFTKPDAYPIKTYVEYGLDKDPKEEFKNDPLTSVLELLGHINEGEQIWFQMIVRAHKKEKRHISFKLLLIGEQMLKLKLKKFMKRLKLKVEPVHHLAKLNSLTVLKEISVNLLMMWDLDVSIMLLIRQIVVSKRLLVFEDCSSLLVQII
jgi:hypothetical protein